LSRRRGIDMAGPFSMPFSGFWLLVSDSCLPNGRDQKAFPKVRLKENSRERTG